MRTDMVSHKNRQRLILTALILVFSMPFAAAWFLYNFSDVGKRDKGGNYGELLVSTVSMPDTRLLDPLTGEYNHSLRGKWNLIYMMAGDCALECRRSLDMMPGLKNALVKDSGRLQIIVSTSDSVFEKNLREYLATYSGDRILLLPYSDNAGIPGQVPPSAKPGDLERGKFYIIDPLGNLILSYSANTNPEGIISDLKRLLRYSRIG